MTTDLHDNTEYDKFIDELLNIKSEDIDNLSNDDVISIDDTSEDDVILIEENTETKHIASSTTTPAPSNQPLRELESQQQRMNTMCIIGIPHREYEILEEIFLRICRKLDVEISFGDDILEIYRSSAILIGVKFNNIRKKEEILNCDSNLYADDILYNLPKNQIKRIELSNYMTKFYATIECHLRQAEKCNRIYSYRLSRDGFVFKKTQDGEENVILNIEQFEEIMRNENSN